MSPPPPFPHLNNMVALLQSTTTGDASVLPIHLVNLRSTKVNLTISIDNLHFYMYGPPCPPYFCSESSPMTKYGFHFFQHYHHFQWICLLHIWFYNRIRSGCSCLKFNLCSFSLLGKKYHFLMTVKLFENSAIDMPGIWLCEKNSEFLSICCVGEFDPNIFMYELLYICHKNDQNFCIKKMH